MPKVVMYTTNMCPYCVRAKILLGNKGVQVEELNIQGDRALMREMMERSQRRTVPQIFIDDFHVGGFDDLAAMESRGELDPMLGISTESFAHGADASEDGPT